MELPIRDLENLENCYHKWGTTDDFLIPCILFAPNAPPQNPVQDIW